MAIAALSRDPAVDVHVYDLDEKTLRRVASGAGQAMLPKTHDPWSPDGRWLSHLEVDLIPCSVAANSVAAADGSASRRLPGTGSLRPAAWLGPTRLLLSAAPA